MILSETTPRNPTPNALAKPICKFYNNSTCLYGNSGKGCPITTLMPVGSLYSLYPVDPVDAPAETVPSFNPGCVDNLSPPVNASPLIALCVMSWPPNGQHQRIPALLQKYTTGTQGTQYILITAMQELEAWLMAAMDNKLKALKAQSQYPDRTRQRISKQLCQSPTDSRRKSLMARLIKIERKLQQLYCKQLEAQEERAINNIKMNHKYLYL